MLTSLMLALALTANITAAGGDWSPFFSYIGSWSGTSTTTTGKLNVPRDYEAVDNNHRLLVSDRVGSSRTPWGLVSYDPARGAFVLSRFGADGSTADLVLREVSDGGATLVFDAAPGNA